MISRVALAAQTVNETIVGGFVGVSSVGVFQAKRRDPAVFAPFITGVVRSSPLAAVHFGCLLCTAHHWSAEPWVEALAAKFGVVARLCH